MGVPSTPLAVDAEGRILPMGRKSSQAELRELYRQRYGEPLPIWLPIIGSATTTFLLMAFG